MSVRRSAAVAAVSITGALVLTTGVGAALGAAPLVDAKGVIHSCVASSGAVRVVTGACKSGERALAWNQTGVRGATGAAGATGSRGAAGATGTAGAPGASGSTGPGGAPGANGAPGTPGVKGDPGIPGAPGSKGDPGTPGAPGAKGDTGAAGAGQVLKKTVYPDATTQAMTTAAENSDGVGRRLVTDSVDVPADGFVTVLFHAHFDYPGDATCSDPDFFVSGGQLQVYSDGESVNGGSSWYSAAVERPYSGSTDQLQRTVYLKAGHHTLVLGYESSQPCNDGAKLGTLGISETTLEILEL